MTTKFAPKTWVGALRMTSTFGAIDAAHKTPHSGNDIITAGDVLAPFDGVVTRDIAQGDSGGGLGNYFQVVSLDGRFVFTVGHCNRNSDNGLRRGDRVFASQVILKDMGRPTTGRSTGPHRHEQLTDNGRLVDHLDYLGKTWGESNKPKPVATDWDGVSTLYKGNYADDGLVYTIRVGETIWGVAQAKGVSLDQVRAWTTALAASKYGAAQLAKSGSGASWWNGGNTYYAGATIAVADVVARFAAEDKVAAQAKKDTAAQAAQAAVEAAEAARVVEITLADEVEVEPIDRVRADALLAAKQADQALVEAEVELALAVDRANAHLPQVESTIAKALAGGPEAAPEAPLAGLLADSPKARKSVYYAYAGAALVVSIGPDVVLAGLLTDAQTPTFVAAIALASSILLKVGTAFGFVAASNTNGKG